MPESPLRSLFQIAGMVASGLRRCHRRERLLALVAQQVVGIEALQISETMHEFPKQPSCFFRRYGLQAPGDDTLPDYCGWQSSREQLLKFISTNDKSS